MSIKMSSKSEKRSRDKGIKWHDVECVIMLKVLGANNRDLFY